MHSRQKTEHILVERIKNAIEQIEPNLKDQCILTEAASGVFLAVDAISTAVNCGVGEIVVTSVDREGTFSGPDFEMSEDLSTVSPVPFIYQGGVSSTSDIKNLLTKKDISGVAVGSFFTFLEKNQGVLINYPTADMEKIISEVTKKQTVDK